MSLHAQISPDVLARLKTQQRNNTIVSVIIALLSLTLVALLFFWILLPSAEVYNEDIKAYTTSQNDEEIVQEKEIQRPVESQPVSPASSASMAKVLASQSVTKIAIPVPDDVVLEDSTDFGEEIDFDATSWGEEVSVQKFSSVFGDVSPDAKGLRGRLYDFKQTSRKRLNKDYKLTHYGRIVKEIVGKKYSKSSLSDFFQAPQDLYLTSLAISLRPAEEAPKYFGAEKDIEPIGWIAHYTGTVTVPKSGRYRFIGKGDDYISVSIDDKAVLFACWNSIQPDVVGRWEPSEDSGTWKSPFGVNEPLIHGTWLDLKEGQQVKMDLTIGERPGGYLGYVLLIEEEGRRYSKDNNGRPVLPLFTTEAFSVKKKSAIKKAFNRYEFEWRKVPVFTVN